ncbi:hypothetical protein niasHS_015873 [Heterodera schachtii]|uniref:Spaetzle domain-containing protein n=1 Tax=Heterodera schachtii TaxID=97005 RepID=A0ABD2HWS1_HETSC
MEQKPLVFVLHIFLVLQLCQVVNSFRKYRGHQKHHNTVFTKHGHSEEDGGDQQQLQDEGITLHNECYFRYAETDHHYAFLRWLHHKNVSHYTPISPSYEKILRRVQPDDIKNGLQITMGTQHGQQQSCDIRHRRMKPVHPNMPIIDRALCQYEYILNYKPNRIPATLSEVKCICARPFTIGATRFECEPLYYHVRVLLFENDCLNYVEHTEKVAFACVPVFKPSIEYEDSFIDVPAEEPN